jgi:hypothetical protein
MVRDGLRLPFVEPPPPEPTLASRWGVEMQTPDGSWVTVGSIKSQQFVALDPAAPIDPVLWRYFDGGHA